MKISNIAVLIALCAVSASSNATKSDEVCKASKSYKLYESADKIVIYRNKIISAQNQIADDDAAAQIGGISNKSLRYKSSQDIVRYTRWTNEEFNKYKQLGGTALSAGNVQKPKSPCW